MPEIPRYERRVFPKAIDEPMIPLSFGQAEEASMGQAGGQLADTAFRLAKEDNDLRFISQLSDLHTSAMQRITDLRRKTVTSPDFYADPDTAAAGFAQQVEALKGEYLGQIKDPRMQAIFKKQLGMEVLTQINHVTDAAVNQRKANGEGLLYNSINRLGQMADNAPSDEEAQRYMGQAEAYYGLMEKNGLIKPEQRVKEIERFHSDRAERRAIVAIHADPVAAQQKLVSGEGIFGLLRADRRTTLAEHAAREALHFRDRQEREFQKQAVNSAYDELTTMFPGDYGRAVEYARDPKNYPLMDEEKRRGLVSALENGANWDRQQREQNQKKTNDLVFDNFLKNPAGMNEATIIATAADPQIKQHLIDISRKNTEQRFRTDPGVEADVLGKIWSGKITNRSELLAYVGNGLGVDKVKDLAGSIDIAQDPTKSRYFQMAEEVFAQKYKDDADAQKQKAEFLYLLDQHVKREGLKGPDIFKRAEELMKPIDEGRWWKVWQWFGVGDTTPPYQKIIKDNPPWITVEEPPAAPESTPIVRPVPKPAGGQPSQERAEPETDYSISDEQRTAITGMLKQAGYPLTEGNIQAMARKLKGE